MSPEVGRLCECQSRHFDLRYYLLVCRHPNILQHLLHYAHLALIQHTCLLYCTTITSAWGRFLHPVLESSFIAVWAYGYLHWFVGTASVTHCMPTRQELNIPNYGQAKRVSWIQGLVIFLAVF